MRGIHFGLLIASFLLAASSGADSYVSLSARAVWKSADYGDVNYEKCELRSNLDFESSYFNLQRISLNCEGANEGAWPFSQEIANYRFQIDALGNVFLAHRIVGSFKDKIFQATFRSEHEENIFVKIRLLENQTVSIVVSVDAVEFPSFEFWSE